MIKYAISFIVLCRYLDYYSLEQILILQIVNIKIWHIYSLIVESE